MSGGRNKFDNETLGFVCANIDTMKKIIDDVISGVSISRAAYNEGISMSRLRRAFETMENLKEPVNTKEKLDIAAFATPVEKFYSDILLIDEHSPELWENMPDDAEATMAYLIENGDFNGRERGILKYRYLDGKKLDEVGEVYGVTRERIREIQAKAVRKLRWRGDNQYILRYGIGMWNSSENEYIQRKEEIISRLAEMRLERDSEVFLAKKELNKNDEFMNRKIEEAGLSVRTFNVLKRMGKDTLGDIASEHASAVARYRNMGKKSLEELYNTIVNFGVKDCIFCKTYKEMFA